ncbi:SDR family NAD(P)-dependent oxidoreductase [Thalassotalea piscium]
MTQNKTIHLNKVLEEHSQDMTSKVVAITGTTSGTGFVFAREVAKKGATVLLLNRTSARSENAYKQLTEAVPSGKFEAITCDLQDFESVKQAAEQIKSEYSVLDVLVNNASIMAVKDEATKDGYDVQMQTNAISHFLLTKELYPLLKNSSEARVINQTSLARLGGPLEPAYFEKNGGNLGGNGTPEETANFQGARWERYHQTKLANATFTYGLKKKLLEANVKNIISLLAHPGVAITNLQATSAETGGMDVNGGVMSQAQSAEDGAAGIIRAAMDKEAKSGDFYGPIEGISGFPNLLEPEELLFDESNVAINWNGCEKAVGEFKI